MPDSISIRPASPDDVPLVLEFIRELAIYEELTAKCKEIVSASPADVNKKLDEMTALANKLSD